MFGKSSSLLFCVSVLCLVLLVLIPSKSHQRTRTATYQVLRPGSVFVSQLDMDALRLRRAGVFPQAYIDLEILNSTFGTDSADCRSSLANLITGPGWLPTELFADIPITQASSFSNKATLHFKGSALFSAARTSADDGSLYTIRLPSSCTSQQLSGPVTFKITPTQSTRLAELLAFLILLAGTLGFLAVLYGMSIYAYVPVQIAVLIASSGCGPLDLQFESYTVGFILSPLPYTSRDLMPHYHMVLTNLLIFFILTVIEVAHFGVRWLTNEAYRYRLVASMRGKRELFMSNYKATPTETNPNPLPALPPEDVPRRPMPFYMLFCMFATIGGGMWYHCIRLLGYEAVDIKHYGAAAIGIVVWFAFFAISVTVSLTKGAFYKPFSSTKKVLPRFISPDGVTGPNVFRLSFGAIVGDMRQGSRYASTFPMIFTAVFGALIAATAPSSTGCRTTLSLTWLLTFLFGLFIYRAQPLRSVASNVLAVGSVIAALVAISCLLAYGGYGGSTQDANHWSGRGTILATIVLCFISILNSLLVFVTGTVIELSGNEAQRTAKYSDGRGDIMSMGLLSSRRNKAKNDKAKNATSSATGDNNNNGEVQEEDEDDPGGAQHLGNDAPDASSLRANGAELFDWHVATILTDMEELIDDGGGQPLEPDETTTRGIGRSGGHHLQAPTLAQFLYQDIDALPKATVESIVASEALERMARLRSSGGRSSINNNGNNAPTLRNNTRNVNTKGWGGATSSPERGRGQTMVSSIDPTYL